MALPFVVAVIVDSDGNFLIGKHPNLKTKPYPGLWDIPGGKLENHETPAEAIAREVKEETGFDVLEVSLLDVFHHNKNNMLESVNSVLPGIAVGYSVTVEGEFIPSEFDEVRWVSIEELSNYILVPWAEYFLFEKYKKS